MKANKYYTTLDTKNILALIYDLKLTQITNSSISHNAACQNSRRIFLCLEQSQVKYSTTSDKKILSIPSLNKIM